MLVAELLSRNMGESRWRTPRGPWMKWSPGLRSWLRPTSCGVFRAPLPGDFTSAASTQWYDNILTSLAELLLVVGRSGIIQSANQAASVMLDWKDDLVGRNIAEFFVDTIDLEVMSSRDVESDESRNAARHFEGSEGERVPCPFLVLGSLTTMVIFEPLLASCGISERG